MKVSGYIIAAAALIVAVYLTYFIQFYFILGSTSVSNDSAVWGQLGDYVGGILNPLLSFVSIFLLIKSLSLQNDANHTLRTEMKHNGKAEKLRSFEILFFNLINSQKNIFDSFGIDFTLDGNESEQLTGVEAVMRIEEGIKKIRADGKGEIEIKDYLNDIDKGDRVFGRGCPR